MELKPCRKRKAVVSPYDPETAYLPLTKGKVAAIDSEDIGRVSIHANIMEITGMLGTELKICPFCGSPKVVSVIQDGPRPPRHHYVMCESCSAGGPVFSGSASASASAEDAWNRRAEPAKPEQSDWERAETLYRNGPEVLDGERFPAAIAALLAEVRAEERERCQKVLSRQLEYIEAARALQRKLNGIFPNHRPLYHANGGLCREADYHKELKDLNHALDEVAAAIRKGEP